MPPQLKKKLSVHTQCAQKWFFFSSLKFSIDCEFSLMALDYYCHSRNTNSRCLRTTVQLYSNKKKILFAHLKYHESAVRFISALISQSGKWEAGAQPGVCLLSPRRRAVSTCRGAALDTRVCRTFIQRCACVWSVERAHWATAGTDEVWFECWAEKKIDWMVDIDSSKSTSKDWLLSLCWHICYGCRFMLVR